MSQIPSDPGTNDRRRRSLDRRRRSLTDDELIAMFVAFLTLGSVLFWGLTRSGVNMSGSAGLFNADGAPSLIGDLDGDSQLGNLAIGTDLNGGDSELGFGSAEAVAAAGATRVLGDSERGDLIEVPTMEGVPTTGQIAVSQSTTVSPEGTTVVPKSATPEEPPQQTAQPAEEANAKADLAPTQEDLAVTEDSAAVKAPETPAAPVAPPLEVTQEALQFTDVPNDYWAKPYIDALSERDVFDGIIVDGVAEGDTFKPDEPISRAQLARAITKAFPLSAKEAAISFSDVAADFWALDFINEAVKGGYMNGFPDGSFKPDLPVPRDQALTAMVTGSSSAVQGDAADVVKRYTDAGDIKNWAVPKVAAATQAGLVVNHPNLQTLNPNQSATRAEVAAMIYQTLVAQGRIDSIKGEYIVKP